MKVFEKLGVGENRRPETEGTLTNLRPWALEHPLEDLELLVGAHFGQKIQQFKIADHGLGRRLRICHGLLLGPYLEIEVPPFVTIYFSIRR